MSEYKNGNRSNNCVNTQNSRNISTENHAASRREIPQPNAYLIAKMNSRNGVSDSFRHGEYNGQKYMTTGDFLRYYNRTGTTVAPDMAQKRAAAVTKEFKRPPVQAEAIYRPENDRAPVSAEKEDVRIRNPYKKTASHSVSKYDPNADTIRMPAYKNTNKIKGRVAKIVAKWFPQENKNEKAENEKKRFPVAAIGLLISLSVAMTVIVSTSVMTSKSQSEISDLKNDISALKAEGEYLEEELVKRDDLAYITRYATEELGMIKENYGSSVYLELGESDSVSGAEESGESFAALLAAIFGE